MRARDILNITPYGALKTIAALLALSSGPACKSTRETNATTSPGSGRPASSAVAEATSASASPSASPSAATTESAMVPVPAASVTSALAPIALIQVPHSMNGPASARSPAPIISLSPFGGEAYLTVENSVLRRQPGAAFEGILDLPSAMPLSDGADDPAGGIPAMLDLSGLGAMYAPGGQPILFRAFSSSLLSDEIREDHVGWYRSTNAYVKEVSSVTGVTAYRGFALAVEGGRMVVEPPNVPVKAPALPRVGTADALERVEDVASVYPDVLLAIGPAPGSAGRVSVVSWPSAGASATVVQLGDTGLGASRPRAFIEASPKLQAALVETKTGVAAFAIEGGVAVPFPFPEARGVLAFDLGPSGELAVVVQAAPGAPAACSKTGLVILMGDRGGAWRCLALPDLGADDGRRHGKNRCAGLFVDRGGAVFVAVDDDLESGLYGTVEDPIHDKFPPRSKWAQYERDE